MQLFLAALFKIVKNGTNENAHHLMTGKMNPSSSVYSYNGKHTEQEKVLRSVTT